MLTLALLLITSQLNDLRPERARGDFRVSRSGNGLPFFSAFEVSGAGVGAECACANPTGAKGETSATVRANALDCRKGGPWRVSGIAVGDVVSCASNLPRIEQDGSGVLGLEAWGGFVQTALRSDELDNVVWTSTEAVTSNDATAPDNTATADRLNDTNGAVQSCTSQVIATTSATVHVVSSYVRGGSVSEAQISMTGTGSSTGDCSATVTGLSTSTWDRLWCKSPAAYAGTLTAVTISVCVGDAVGDIGTIYAWRFNHSVNFPAGIVYPPPSLQAVAASATSAVEQFAFTLPTAMSASSGSHAISLTATWPDSAAVVPVIAANLMAYDTAARMVYASGDLGGGRSRIRIWDGTYDTLHSVSAWSTGVSARFWSSYSGSTTQISGNGASPTSGTFDGTMGVGALTTFRIGSTAINAAPFYGVVTRICADPNPLRCR